jgi:NAD(P)-dependent dehydrogenase (short-subunit alcohol dehydrogenase family)
VTGRFEGRVAAVAGVGPVGRAVATRFGSEGALVVVGDLDAGAARAAAAAVESAGGTAVPAELDVSDESAVARFLAIAGDQFGRLDILHNNVGFSSPDDRGVADLDLTVWSRTMEVNAGGAMLGCKHAFPLMRSAGGVIINTASVAGLWGDGVLAAYGSSKAAIMTLTKYVAAMYGEFGIRCNAVAPSLILSEEHRPALEETGLLLELTSERLLDWAATPEEIAGVVAWLASDEARGITGQTIVVDSGTTAHRHRHTLKKWEALRGAHPELGTWSQ